MKSAFTDCESFKVPSKILEGVDYITVPLKRGPRYAMLVAGERVIAVESGASRGLFRRRSMFKQYVLMDGKCLYTLRLRKQSL